MSIAASEERSERGAEQSSAIAVPEIAVAAQTPRGVFGLRTVSLDKHLELVHRWMHAEHVVAYWQQAWPRERVESYLREQLDGAVSRPCLGSLAGVPVSYWEVYRPAGDPLGEAYQVDPHDLGIHVLIGERGLTGHGLGSMLLAAAAAEILRLDPACRRIVAEPDVRNVPSIKAFIRAGFRRSHDIELPNKTAALMVYEEQK